jgi:hypothetical protein
MFYKTPVNTPYKILTAVKEIHMYCATVYARSGISKIQKNY